MTPVVVSLPGEAKSVAPDHGIDIIVQMYGGERRIERLENGEHTAKHLSKSQEDVW